MMVAGVRGIARVAGVLGLILGSAGALATPAAAAAGPGGAAVHRPGVPGHWPGVAARQPGLMRPPGLAQPAFPAGLWHPGNALPGSLLPAASLPAVSPAAGGAAGSPWRIQQTPNPVIHNGRLDAISCTSPGACIAVGGYENRAGTEVPLAQARTSTGWRIHAAPVPPGAVFTTLFGVSCTAVDACIAAGYYVDGARHIHPLAEAWNGTSWKIQPAPSPAGHPLSGFFAVSCASARACTAVGAATGTTGTTTALAERWNGTTWSIQAAPSPAGSAGSEFLAVSCPAATACTAGGASLDSTGTSVPLAERWNGTTWNIEPTPSPAGSTGSGFAGLSCGSATACTAVGSYATGSGATALLAEAWHGTTWSIQATPSPAGSIGDQFLAVSCTAPGACTAAGSVTLSSPAGRPGGSGSSMTVGLAERWNGTNWRIQLIPSPGRSIGTGFGAVSCSASVGCTAAGSYDTTSHLGRPVAAAWRGTSWHLQATPAPAGASVASGLFGVSCPSARTCLAVGSGTAVTGESTTLAERWDGSRWRIQPSAVPAGAVSAGLSGVACSSPRACTAVGSYFSQRELAMAERWDGSAWRLQPVAIPAGARNGSTLFAVSCPAANRCFAVGEYFTKSERSVALAEMWNGTRWMIQSLPGAASNTLLLGVSCTAPSACAAVGDHGSEIWNGTGWRFVPMTTPPGGQALELNGVSCTSGSACTAVGFYFSPAGGPLTLAETWNGTAWRVQATPNPITQGRNQLNSVSCTSPRACTAVGVDAASDFAPPGQFAETWNGTRWQLQATPVPAGTVLSELFNVSCPLAAACTAAGLSAGPSNITVTLALTTARR